MLSKLKLLKHRLGQELSRRAFFLVSTLYIIAFIARTFFSCNMALFQFLWSIFRFIHGLHSNPSKEFYYRRHRGPGEEFEKYALSGSSCMLIRSLMIVSDSLIQIFSASADSVELILSLLLQVNHLSCHSSSLHFRSCCFCQIAIIIPCIIMLCLLQAYMKRDCMRRIINDSSLVLGKSKQLCLKLFFTQTPSSNIIGICPPW